MTPELFASEHGLTLAQADIILSIFRRPTLASEYVVLARDLNASKAGQLAASLIQRSHDNE